MAIGQTLAVAVAAVAALLPGAAGQCAANERTSGGVCVPCPTGTTSAAGTNTCCNLPSGSQYFEELPAGTPAGSAHNLAKTVACANFLPGSGQPACEADVGAEASYMASCPYLLGGVADLQECYDKLKTSPLVLAALSATPLSAGPWKTMFEDAQLDVENTHVIKALEWAYSDRATPAAVCANDDVKAEWHAVLDKCDGASGATRFAALKENPYCSGVRNCATQGTCEDDNESVFARPYILFFVIIGGALIIIFTQCAIVATAATFCCPSKKDDGKEAP